MPHMTATALQTLMGNAVVNTGMLRNAVVSGRPETLFLVKEKHAKGKNGINDCDVYSLKNMASPVATDDPAASLFSYIVDYAVGETCMQVLGSEADFCFTVTINGCTFALGMPASDGTLVVSHTNMKKVSGKSSTTDFAAITGSVDVPSELTSMVQENVQAKVVTGLHGSGRLLGPTQYYNGNRNNRLTVFGLRGHAGWTFYYQSYTVQSGVYYLEGVQTFSTQSVTF